MPSKQQKSKVRKVMHEFRTGQLRAGSKRGPKVKSRKQAIAIALSEAGMSRSGRRKPKRGGKKRR